MKRPGVLLDRDGTLIDFVRDPELGSVQSAFHPSQLRFLPGVIDGLRHLSEHGFLLAIATNQPGAAKGQIPVSAIHRTNDALVEQLRTERIQIERVAVCLHHPEGGPSGDPELIGPCACRKPKPGLLLSLIESLDLDPERTFMVGDNLADLQAGAAAGVRAALVIDPNRCERCPLRTDNIPPGMSPPLRAPDFRAPRLDAIAREITTRIQA